MIKITKSEHAALGFDLPQAVVDFKLALDAHNARPTDWGPSPSPGTDPLVMEAALNGYEIVDDPKPSLHDVKIVFEQKINSAAEAARETILPRRKRRLAELNYEHSMSIEPEKRSESDKEIIAHYVVLIKQFRNIESQTARVLHNLEDVTDPDVLNDEWIKPFSS